jgi:hypothetical protein
MKKIVYALFVLMVTFLGSMTFASCGDDDDIGSGGLSGRWISKDYQSEIIYHYNMWKNDRSGLYVSDGMFVGYEFSGTSAKEYKYIYTFDGVLKNYPDKNHSYKKLSSATYNGVSVTWYADLRDSYSFVVTDNSLIMGNGRTGSFRDGRLSIGGSEYEKFK